MGFLTRLLIPRPVRRALHPVRTTKGVARRAVVPKPIRQITYGASQLKNPVRAAGYHGIERPLATALRSGASKRRRTPAPVYMHGGCPVRHRSIETMQRCAQGTKSPSPSSRTRGEPNVRRVLSESQLRDQAVADLTWLLQHPEFHSASTNLQETVPELGPLLEEGEFDEAANLLVQLRLLGRGSRRAEAADFAEVCAKVRRELSSMQRPSGP